ncbi:hypothetical protein TNCV_964181 [Trichonephila clavipes]|nr:hypothetical protein TNCV_964181 [Trichonephila clavipes]
MSLRRHRRQCEQLPKFKREKIIGMMEAGWSARRVARQVGRFDLTTRMCWDHRGQKRCHLHSNQALDNLD